MIHAHSLGRAAHYYGNGRRLLQARRGRLSGSFTIVLRLLPRPSADTGSELVTAWPCSCQMNPTISSSFMLVPGWE
jgi:hypothetical protein